MPDPVLIGLCLNAFLAATLLPIPSEVMFVALVTDHHSSLVRLWIFATLGNVAGALCNWVLGRLFRHYQDRRWFPFNRRTIEKAQQRFARHGAWWLLLAWLPVIGDPLTFVAGVLRISLPLFLLLVTLGKGGRYLVLILAVDAW